MVIYYNTLRKLNTVNERKFTFKEVLQLISKEEMIEYHHLATSNELGNGGVKH